MNPQEFNPLKEYEIPIGGEEFPWRKVSGREIFESDSLTSLNKIPVKVLGSFIQGGATLTAVSPLFSLRDLVEHLLVDGTVVVQNLTVATARKGDREEIGFMKNLVEVTKTRIVQLQTKYTDDKEIVHRIYTLKGERWDWQDVIKLGTPQEGSIKQSTEGISVSNLFVYLNGHGILYDGQFTYRRLEEIEQKVRKVTRSSVTKIVSGYVGMMEQMYAAMKAREGTEDEGTLVVPTGMTVDIPKTTTVTDQLHKDFMVLLPGYFRMTEMIELKDIPDVSGISRRLLMKQTLEFTALTREVIKEIYSNWNITVVFDPLPTYSADEKVKELSFLRELRDDQVITKKEYKEKARNLL